MTVRMELCVGLLKPMWREMDPDKARFFDARDRVKTRFREVKQIDTSGVLPGARPLAPRTVWVNVLVRPRTSVARQKEIAKAIRAIPLPKGCSWSKRDDGPVWVFDDVKKFTTN